jgi:hypothetical protein
MTFARWFPGPLNMFALVVVVAVLSVVSARLNTQPDVLAALRAGNSIMPKEWSALKFGGKSSSNPSGYYEIKTYSTSNKCAGSPTSITGIALGMCMVSGTTSMEYDWGKTAKTYAMKLFTTPDCTGTATTYDVPIPGCTASGTTGYVYALVNSTTPWTSYDKGVINE